MKRILLAAVALMSLAVFNPAHARSNTIADVVTKANGFDTLQFALETAGLLHLLDGHQKFTLFAPTDEAFQDLADALTGGDVLALATALVNADLLDDVLAYHVAENKRSPRNILKSGTITAVSGQELTTGVNNEGLFVQGINNASPSSIVVKGIWTRNGIVYPIDQVLINIDPADL